MERDVRTFFVLPLLLCCAIAHEHQQHDGHTHHHENRGHHEERVDKHAMIDRFDLDVWAEALFATALVGAVPVLVLLVVPLGIGSAHTQQPLLRVFLSFAAGGLLGDAMLHLLPHSLPDHNHDHTHGHHSHTLSDLSVWLYTLAGIISFLLLEKLVRAHTGHAHDHTHKKDKQSDSEDDDDQAPPSAPIAAAGYLNLAADFTHNFTDGLAIGATFLRGTGWQTTLAMLLHELPHEIGDFAILLQSGFSRKQAMLTQLLTAVGAIVGCVLGLLMEGAGDSSSAWISPFTAGGFIYIACTSVLPELLEDCSFLQSMKETMAMCVGIGLMTAIALTE